MTRIADSRKEINFVKHVLPKKFNYFDYIKTDVKQQIKMNILGQSHVHYFYLRIIPAKVVMKKTSNLTKK